MYHTNTLPEKNYLKKDSQRSKGNSRKKRQKEGGDLCSYPPIHSFIHSPIYLLILSFSIYFFYLNK